MAENNEKKLAKKFDDLLNSNSNNDEEKRFAMYKVAEDKSLNELTQKRKRLENNMGKVVANDAKVKSDTKKPKGILGWLFGSNNGGRKINSNKKRKTRRKNKGKTLKKNKKNKSIRKRTRGKK
tara:strand:+ start:1979 stop:2347 length:369 start_codon:yes stop_codon:yes gene_type:complete